MILRSLARSYYISSASEPENLEKAEEVLKELTRVLDEVEDAVCHLFHVSKAELTAHQAKAEEYQQVRWMSLAVCKKRNGTSNETLLSRQLH